MSVTSSFKSIARLGLRQIKQNKSLRRVGIITVAVLGFGMVASAAAVTYIGFKSVELVSRSVPEMASMNLPDQALIPADGIKIQWNQKTYKLMPASCYSSLLAHVEPQTWLFNPLSHNLNVIKNACFIPITPQSDTDLGPYNQS